MRIAHYINQFFAGIGGEDKADTLLEVRQGAVGPGLALQNALAGAGQVVTTFVCGDNYFAEHQAAVAEAIVAALAAQPPDLFVAGPAFNAGRYGLACGAVCAAVREHLKVPVVTAMHPDNPAAQLYRKQVLIAPAAASAAGMSAAMSGIARLGKKLVAGVELGPAAEEGYVPQGIRRNLFLQKNAAERAADMLVAKLNGQPFRTELRVEQFEPVAPAPPLPDLSKAVIAIVTESGVVPKGNPDHLEWARASKWLRYSIAGLQDLTAETHQAIHGGFDNTWTNQDPDRTLGVDVLRQLERERFIGSLCDYYYVTMGNGGDLNYMTRFGKEIALDLKALGVHGVISPAT